MELRVPVKKHTFFTKPNETKAEFLERFGSGYVLSYMMNRGHGTTPFQTSTFRNRDGDYVFGMVFEKHKPKIEVKRNSRRKTTPLGPQYVRKVVKEGYWKVIVYMFPRELLKISGLQVVQFPRTFKIQKLK